MEFMIYIKITIISSFRLSVFLVDIIICESMHDERFLCFMYRFIGEGRIFLLNLQAV